MSPLLALAYQYLPHSKDNLVGPSAPVPYHTYSMLVVGHDLLEYHSIFFLRSIIVISRTDYQTNAYVRCEEGTTQYADHCNIIYICHTSNSSAIGIKYFAYIKIFSI